MDWNDSPEQAAFREEAAKFIQERLPEYYRNSDDEGGGEGLFGWYADRISEDPTVKQAADDWAAALAERGWVAPALAEGVRRRRPDHDGAVHPQRRSWRAPRRPMVGGSGV